MASQPTKAKQSSRWGSLLSGAVAGIESRLDTILAEDNEASARSRAADKAAVEAKAGHPTRDGSSLGPTTESGDVSRNSSRNRVNDRLQERLAKAMANQKPGGLVPSETPSRTASPLIGGDSPRTSLGSRPSTDIPRPVLVKQEAPQAPPSGQPHGTVEAPADTELQTSSTLLTSGLPINPARLSLDSGSRASTVVQEASEHVSDHEIEAVETDGTNEVSKTFAELEAEVAQMRADHAEAEKQRQEEMHENLERIDALQAKLQYLAKETVNAAKEANANASSGNPEHRLAEKDERIALLMEEGEKLSKTEMRHLTTIKKLRAKAKDEEKTAAEMERRSAKVDQVATDLRQRLKRLEQSERQSAEKLKRLPKIEADAHSLKGELESSSLTITTLRKQLAEAETMIEEAEQGTKKAALLVDSKKILDLQDALSDAKIERKLADDRAGAEIRRIAEVAEREKERSHSLELELRNEVSNLESRMETLRFRAEEASSDSAGDSQAKLLRQIETLQTQYSLAAENWRSIESSLNARVTAAEKERDEASKRETDVRKKARDISNVSRKTERELETASEQSRQLNESLEDQRQEVKKLQSRFESSDRALEEAKTDFERQRRLWEVNLNQRLEEERSRQNNQGQGSHNKPSGTQSPTSYHRKASGLDSLPQRRGLSRVFSNESGSLMTLDRLNSRRSSAVPTPVLYSRPSFTPDYLNSPSVSRPDSTLSLSRLNIPPTPSIHATDMDADDSFEQDSSPHQTVNDVISASTVHTGPSVQLVERMSSSIRRLESEKAAHKDELARLLSQRDDARDEVVALMREVEGKKDMNEKAAQFEKEAKDIGGRYEACLEMLGEREEEVQELKGDVADLKQMYRELAEKMGR